MNYPVRGDNRDTHSEGAVRRGAKNPPETAGFVGEQSSRPARLLVVHLESLVWTIDMVALVSTQSRRRA
jgi:hypothetical protein